MIPNAAQKAAFAEQGFFIADPLHDDATLDEVAAEFERIRLHSSGPNVTDGPRRAYVIQYAPTHAINPRSGEPWGDCLPVAREGIPLSL